MGVIYAGQKDARGRESYQDAFARLVGGFGDNKHYVLSPQDSSFFDSWIQKRAEAEFNRQYPNCRFSDASSSVVDGLKVRALEALASRTSAFYKPLPNGHSDIGKIPREQRVAETGINEAIASITRGGNMARLINTDKFKDWLFEYAFAFAQEAKSDVHLNPDKVPRVAYEKVKQFWKLIPVLTERRIAVARAKLRAGNTDVDEELAPFDLDAYLASNPPEVVARRDYETMRTARASELN